MILPAWLADVSCQMTSAVVLMTENLAHVTAEERALSNFISDDDKACQELYDLTFDFQQL